MYLHAITLLFLYLPHQSNNIILKSLDMSGARVVMKTVQGTNLLFCTIHAPTQMLSINDD